MRTSRPASDGYCIHRNRRQALRRAVDGRGQSCRAGVADEQVTSTAAMLPASIESASTVGEMHDVGQGQRRDRDRPADSPRGCYTTPTCRTSDSPPSSRTSFHYACNSLILDNTTTATTVLGSGQDVKQQGVVHSVAFQYDQPGRRCEGCVTAVVRRSWRNMGEALLDGCRGNSGHR